MKIAYVTTYDSSNENAWSGSGYYMCKAMEDAGCNIERLGNLKVKMDLIFKMKKAYYHFLLSQKYQKQREPAIVKSYAHQLSTKLLNHSYDAILSPGTIPIAYLKDTRPIIFWTDATFAGLLNFFPDFTNVPRESIEKGNDMEQAALDNCALAIYTSTWAAETALNYYKINPDKIRVIPFGANIDRKPTENDIDRIITGKSFNVCRLLFVGVDWHRKGGELAVKVAEQLNQRGIKTELHIVGCSPPRPLDVAIICHGFLSKKIKEENERIESLYEKSHFLILPSLADCVPVVIAEASSYGLPSVSTNVGGIKSAIDDDVNGKTFDINDDASEYCNYISSLFSSPQKYRKLMLSTFKVFSTTLNWNAAGARVKDEIAKL